MEPEKWGIAITVVLDRLWPVGIPADRTEYICPVLIHYTALCYVGREQVYCI
ncbi:hypothetical protein D3C86_2147860 [compost metagenome]